MKETISIFNSSQLRLNQRVQRDIKHEASHTVAGRGRQHHFLRGTEQKLTE